MKELRFCAYCGGALEERFAEGRTRQVCRACDAVVYRNPLPAATALVLNGAGQLLLGKRAVEPARGQWCLPGGFIEMGETMEQAALRELYEETGLAGAIRSFVGCFYQDSRTYGGVIIFGYRVDADTVGARAGDDMDELRFFDLDPTPRVAFEAHRRLIEEMKKGLG